MEEKERGRERKRKRFTILLLFVQTTGKRLNSFSRFSSGIVCLKICVTMTDTSEKTLLVQSGFPTEQYFSGLKGYSPSCLWLGT